MDSQYILLGSNRQARGERRIRCKSVLCSILLAANCAIPFVARGNSGSASLPCSGAVRDRPVKIEIKVSTLPATLKKLQRAPSLQEIHRETRLTSQPLVFVYEGKERDFVVAPRKLPPMAGNGFDNRTALQFIPAAPKRSYHSRIPTQPLWQAVRNLFPREEMTVEMRRDMNLLFFSDYGLADDDTWPLNLRVDLSTSPAMTYKEGEALLKAMYGWDDASTSVGMDYTLSPNPHVKFTSDSPVRTARDLLLNILYNRARELSHDKAPVPPLFQIIDFGKDETGKRSWNILTL